MSDSTVKQITAKLYGDEPAPTKFRVWWIPQIPGKPFYAEAPDFKTARLIDKTLGRYDIFQCENNIKSDFANVGGIQYWDEYEQAWFDIDEREYGNWEGK